MWHCDKENIYNGGETVHNSVRNPSPEKLQAMKLNFKEILTGHVLEPT